MKKDLSELDAYWVERFEGELQDLLNSRFLRKKEKDGIIITLNSYHDDKAEWERKNRK